MNDEEHLALCKAWVTASENEETGTGAKYSTFWEQITVYYNEHRPAERSERTSRALECKWGTLRRDISKFCGYYAQVESYGLA